MATIERTTTQKANGRHDAALEPYEEPVGAGWVVFAAIMLGFAGVWAFIEGILAISSSKVFTANATYVFSGLHTWGWIVMILGVFTVLAAFAIPTGSELARWFGIAIAALNAMGQLLFLQAYPWWSVAIFAVDMLVIYALAVYAGRRLRAY
jgi:hypothetical protein